VVRPAALTEAAGAEAEAPVVAEVRAVVAEAAREAGAAEAEVAEAVAEVAVAVQAEAVDRAAVVEAAAAAAALAAERRLLQNRQARAPELLTKVIKPNRPAGPRLLLVGISHRSLIFSIHP
jgi:hypothetical protein